MRLRICDYTETPLLAGAPAGRTVLSKLLVAVGKQASSPTRVFLDFGGVEIATASFLREAVFTFRKAIRAERPNLYPIAANANDLVREELLELASLRSETFVVCDLSESEEVTNGQILGELDPKQRLTFNLVLQKRDTSASELMREHGSAEGVTYTTAWNNRLSALASAGLLMEFSEGRSKRYRPIFDEVRYGC